MHKLIIANWKLNPTAESEAVRLARQIDFKNVVIAPPFPFIKSVSAVVKKAKIAAQDVFWKEFGAYTGEVSASQLKSLGVNYVIVGHSERRSLGETDETINKKIKAAFQAGLKVILCVGESWLVRKRGITAAKNLVKKQFQGDLKFPKSYKLQAKSLIIAYEPVWAIGTGKNDSPRNAVEMAKFIKQILNSYFLIHNPSVLYGGSVNPKNAKSFLAQKEIDGALVGGASLSGEKFRRIIRTASGV